MLKSSYQTYHEIPASSVDLDNWLIRRTNLEIQFEDSISEEAHALMCCQKNDRNLSELDIPVAVKRLPWGPSSMGPVFHGLI